jgi:protein-S-isoprenylcysteine O-methyltransferase Ste14
MSRPTPAVRPARRDLPIAAAFAGAVASAAVVSIALSAVVAAIARKAGASHSFKALDVGTYSPLVVIGLLAAAAAWVTIRRRAADRSDFWRGRRLRWSS